MTTQKGHDTLIKAINEIKNTSTPFHCLIAGDGELRQNIEKMIDSYHLENYVTLLGVRNDIPELLTAADILSMPSNYEGLGTTILDAPYESIDAALNAAKLWCNGQGLSCRINDRGVGVQVLAGNGTWRTVCYPANCLQPSLA